MPYTFDAANPFVLPKDHVRVLIGDTVETDESPSDEIINGLLVLHSDSIPRVAVEAAKYIRARLKTRPASRTAVGMTSTRSITDLDKLIEDLEARVDAGAGGLTVRGLQQSEIDAIEDDTDFVRPQFNIGRRRNR